MAYRIVPSALVRVPAGIRQIPAFITNLPNQVNQDMPTKGGGFQMVSSATCLQWVQSDQAVTVVSGAASAWGDISGNGNNYTQGVAGKRPTYTTNVINGKPAIVFDGTDDEMVSAGPNLPAPGTTNSFFWGVFRQDVWATKQPMSSPTANSMILAQNTSSPNLVAGNTTLSALNSGATIGSFARMELLFSNSVNDYLKLGPTSVSGTNLGNLDPAAGYQLGRNPGGTVFASVSFACLGIFNARPNAAERAALDAWAISMYGTSLLV